MKLVITIVFIVQYDFSDFDWIGDHSSPLNPNATMTLYIFSSYATIV